MRRTFRLAGHTRFSYFVGTAACLFILGLAVCFSSQLFSGETELFTRIIVLAVAPLGGAYLLLEVFFKRVVATDDGIAVYTFLNRQKHRIDYAEMESYRPEKGEWTLFVRGEAVDLPGIDFQEFHSLIAERAPAALSAKRWKSGQVPSTEDFLRLGVFEPADWGSKFLTIALVGIVGWIVIRLAKMSPAGFVGALVGPRLIQHLHGLGKIFAHLSLTSTGLTMQWPRRSLDIPWKDITAVFCESRGGRRQFVVTSAKGSITIPPLIARDLEVMRKFFYSLPDGTRCVNFGKNYRSGYRLRRRRGVRVAAPSLTETLGELS